MAYNYKTAGFDFPAVPTTKYVLDWLYKQKLPTDCLGIESRVRKHDKSDVLDHVAELASKYKNDGHNYPKLDVAYCLILNWVGGFKSRKSAESGR